MKAKRQVQRQLKQDYRRYKRRINGLLGDYSGTVEVPNRPGYVFVRMRNQEVKEAFNKKVPNLVDLPVVVGYADDPREPQILQVLDTQTGVERQKGEEPIGLYLPPHHETHEWLNPIGGQDVVFSDKRQFMPFRPTPIGGMLLHVYRNVGWLNGEYTYFSGSSIDLSPYVPATGAYLGLVYEDTDATLAFSSGTGDFLKDGFTLTLSDIPNPIPGTYPIAAVRMWGGMTGIVEAADRTDLIDLRFPFTQNFLLLSDVPWSYTGSASQLVAVKSDETGLEFISSAGITGSGVTTFLGLTDTPSSYSGQATKHVRVNAGANALEFVDAPVSGEDLLVYDDSVFDVTGTAISFDEGLDVVVTGSVAFVEVRDADPERYLGLYNYTFVASPATSIYRIGKVTSSNLREWTIDTEPVIDVGAGASWDDAHVKDPSVVEVDGILYAYYSGHDGSLWKIGLSRSFDKGKTWEKYASNPVLSPTQAWENNVNDEVHTPAVFYDEKEADSSKKFKMWYAGGQFGSGGIGYAYSSDGLTWTKYASNPVVSLGAGGQWDDTYILPGAVIRLDNGTYILFYNGNDGSGTWSGGFAVFSNPESSYTKNSGNPILSGDSKTTTISSNVSIGDTRITVADATVFPLGIPVWVYDGSNHYLTKVTARISSTIIEVSDPAPVAVSSTGGNVKSVAYNSVTIESVVYDAGWIFSISGFQPGGGDLAAGVKEATVLGYSDGLSSIKFDYRAGLLIAIPVSDSESNDDVSRENLSFVKYWDIDDREIPSVTGSYVTIRKNSGSNVGTRSRLNFIEGSNITLTVTDDPSGGEVDITIASSSTGSSGGGLTYVDFAKRTSGDLTLNSTSWADVDTGIDLSLTASDGDIIEVCLSALFGNQATNGGLDVATIVSGSPVNYIGSGGGGSDLGIQGWLGLSGVGSAIGTCVCYAVQAGDISGGTVTLRLRYRTTSATDKTLRANSTQPFQWSAKNLSQ